MFAQGASTSYMAGAPPASPDPTLPDVSWIDVLSAHPIFQDPAPPVSSNRPRRRTRPSRTLQVRSTDVIVAQGAELRMASLLTLKHHASSGVLPDSGLVTPYVVLDSSLLDFDIERIVLNPTGKLLAVIGRHDVVVVVLPRGSLVSSHTSRNGPAAAGATMPVKAARVGAYYHHSRAGQLGAVANARWHPWGKGGSSLVILTKDGILREYETASDIEEPKQVIDVLSTGALTQQRARGGWDGRGSTKRRSVASRGPTPRVASGGRFSRARIGLTPTRAFSAYEEDEEGEVGLDGGIDDLAGAFAGLDTDDDGSRVAASFTFGCEAAAQGAGWNALTVFVLMQNADLWAVCPFLPSEALMPSAYLHQLSALGSRGSDVTFTCARYVSALVREAKIVTDDSQRARSSTPNAAAAARKRTRDVDANGAGLGDLLNTPAKGRRSVSMLRGVTPASGMDLGSEYSAGDEGEGQGDEEDDAELPETMLVRPPRNMPKPVAQGPMLLAPAPHELSDEREAKGADVLFFSVKSVDEGEGGAAEPIDVLVVANDDGRIDVGLALTPVKPKWVGENEAESRREQLGGKKKEGRYALSESEDEWDTSVESLSPPLAATDAMPALFVYETIDLGLLDAISSNDGEARDRLLASHRPTLTCDPLYSDTIYVQHLGGVHALCTRAWVDKLALVMAEAEEIEALQRFFHRSEPTEVRSVIRTSIPTREELDGAKTAADVAELASPAVGLAVVSDVYMSYSLIALTAQRQVVGLELNLRVDVDEAEQEDASQSLQPKALGDGSGKKAYASLLADAFTPPAPFDAAKGPLPVQPRLALRKPASSAELRVTPATLRELGTTVSDLRGQMRDVVKGGNAVQARLDLQMKEMRRQLDKLDEVERRAQALSTEGRLEQRLKRVGDRQKGLVKRVDRVLQRLMDAHQPELSVFEKRWLEEMQRVRGELGGEDEDEGGKTGLVARADKLEYQLSMLRPSLRSMVERKRGAVTNSGTLGAANSPSTPSGFGSKQLAAVEKMLGHESALLVEARNKVQSLSARLGRQGAAARI